MKVTVVFYPFGYPVSGHYDNLTGALEAIANYHNLTNGNASYEIECTTDN